VYFDFESDSLYFGVGNISLNGALKCIGGISNNEKNSIQHLAMDKDLELYPELFMSHMWEFYHEPEEDFDAGNVSSSRVVF
jgi:hypothetical protein